MANWLLANDAFVFVAHLFWGNTIHKKRKDSLETRAELAVLRDYVEN